MHACGRGQDLGRSRAPRALHAALRGGRGRDSSVDEVDAASWAPRDGHDEVGPPSGGRARHGRYHRHQPQRADVRSVSHAPIGKVMSSHTLRTPSDRPSWPGRMNGSDEPILAELFSVERLEQHAQTLAPPVTDTSRRGKLIGPRVAENGRVLLEAYRVLARAIKDERAITPAAEWLVDNFHIVDEQLREIRDDLPNDYYRELPKLAEGHLAGYPRVLGLAWAYVAHTDSRFEPESLRRMVRAYQEVEPLTIGELWAIAISLRILLVENLRRLADQIVRSRAARQRADELADSLLGLGPGQPRGRGSRTSPDCRAPRSRRPPACSSSSACATRTRPSRPRCAGSRSCWPPRGRPPRRWSASSTSARPR